MFYGEDLAYIHNQGFGDLAAHAAREVSRLLKKQNLRRGTVVDLGCGSGILAEALSRSGYQVLGIDSSAAMLTMARKRAPEADFIRGSLFRVRLPRCVAVTAIGETLNYLPQSKTTRLARLFRRVFKSLVPGGVFIFDVAGSRLTKERSDHFLQGRDWAILVGKRGDPRNQVLTRSMTIFRRRGKLYRRSCEVHTEQLYHPTAVLNMLKAAGFKARRLQGYDKLKLLAHRTGFVAQKPLI